MHICNAVLPECFSETLENGCLTLAIVLDVVSFCLRSERNRLLRKQNERLEKIQDVVIKIHTRQKFDK